MIRYEVHTEQRDTIAAKFLENALKDAKVAIKGHEHEINGFDKSFKIVDTLILHSDNGAPMKGQNMINKVNSLGIKYNFPNCIAHTSSYSTLFFFGRPLLFFGAF